MNIILISIICAIPILIWMYLMYRIRPEKKSMLFWAFAAGCFSPLLLLLYQKFWGNTINLIFFELEPINFHQSLSQFSTNYFAQKFLVFLFGVGMAEEFIKHFLVRKEKPSGIVLFFVLMLIFGTCFGIYKFLSGDANNTFLFYFIALWATFYVFVLFHKNLEFTSIDQVILVSVMSALGFAFIENIVYVTRIISEYNVNMNHVVSLFLMRSIFVVMVHMVCSGIFGYYYGISLFAGPYLKRLHQQEKGFFLVSFLCRILRFSKETIYEEEKLLEGLLLAMLLHGIYDFILEINLNLRDLFSLFGVETNVNFPLYNIILAIYLIGGFYYLKYLLQEKENHLKFGLVGTKAMPQEDFDNLLGRIAVIQQHENTESNLLHEKWASKKEIYDLKQQISYLNKFKILEDKYLGNKWISAKNLKCLRAKVAKIKNL